MAGGGGHKSGMPRSPLKQNRTIVLASRSPARFELLKEAGLTLKRSYADIDESRLPREHVTDYAIRIARAKAEKVSPRFKNAIIITADTIIAYGELIFGKPASKREAFQILKKLSGRWHDVYSGIVITDTKTRRSHQKLVKTRVKFMKLTDKQIEWYIGTGEPLKAAGAYSIQSKGRVLIEAVDGCLSNVIGISVAEVLKILQRLKAI